MSRNLFLTILIVSSFAVLGMIFIQFYWIDNALSLKEKEFDSKVRGILKEVAEDLEKKEAVSQLRSHQQGKFLFYNDSINNNLVPQDSSFDVLLMREVRKGSNDIEVQIIEQKEGQKNTQKTKLGLTDTDELVAFMDSNIAIELNKFNRLNVIEKDGVGRDSLVQKSAQQRTAIVGDIVKSLMEVDLFESLDQRIDTSMLYKLIRGKLEESGMEIQFAFGVIDANNDMVLTSNYKRLEDLYASDLKVRLFPNDILGRISWLKIYFPDRSKYLVTEMIGILIISLCIVLATSVGFLVAIFTIIKQKKLSVMKNDFINNMTHEFKTPISTISLACQTLNDQSLEANNMLKERYISIIQEENKRLGELVDKVLQSALLEKDNLKLNLKKVDLVSVVDKAIDVIQFQSEQSNALIEKLYPPKQIIIDIDEGHFVNIISNLLDNAIKYSIDNPTIKVIVQEVNKEVVIKIIDKGIGISKENQRYIFDRLYRVSQGDLHDIKGFGLGLSYVKTIVQHHNGTIEVQSELNKGSTFTIKLQNHDH